jgi:hypothetical protein
MTPRDQLIEEAKRFAVEVRRSSLLAIASADATVEDFEKYLSDELAAEALAESAKYKNIPNAAYQWLLFGGRISALREIKRS